MSQHSPETTAYVFCGGVSHTPQFFDALLDELASHGYDGTAVAYPTIGENTENTTIDDEARAVQEAVEKYADAGKDVVLVGHSYGGWPAARAVHGYDAAARKKVGKKHGIIELAFFAAFLVPEGADMKKFGYLPPFIDVRGGLEHGERKIGKSGIDMMFSDFTPEEKKRWYGELGWQRNAFFGEAMPNAPWSIKTLPKTYIFLTQDQGMPFSMQLDFLNGVIDETWAVKSLASGHEPMVSRPTELAEVLTAPRY